MHYLLFYEASQDYVEKRAQFRSQHLEKAWRASERGELILAGALANPVDGAVLLFKGDSSEVAEKFAKTDPYVTRGLVKRWYVREWTTVAGEESATPLRPATVPKAESKSSSVSREPNPETEKSPILRMWTGHSNNEKADQYAQHAMRTVFPKLREIKGHRGACLLRRSTNRGTEFVVLTLWDSMEAVRAFAGDAPDKAVVEPEAQAVLDRFDDIATHFEVVHGMQNSACTADGSEVSH